MVSGSISKVKNQTPLFLAFSQQWAILTGQNIRQLFNCYAELPFGYIWMTVDQGLTQINILWFPTAINRITSIRNQHVSKGSSGTSVHYLSLNAESSSVIHDAFAHPCNSLCSTIWSVTENCQGWRMQSCLANSVDTWKTESTSCGEDRLWRAICGCFL